MRIFESLLEESGKKRFIKKWLPNDAEKVEEYDKAYEEFAQIFDNEVKKRGLNWQTSMNLEIFEEILDNVKDRKAKTEIKKQNKTAGKSDFLSYVIANPDCDLTYLGTLCKWDYFKIETWPGAMLADSPKSSLNGDTGAKWCIGWRDPEKQMFDKYTSYGLDFILIVKSNNSNTDEEEKYCIQIKREKGAVEGLWIPTNDVFIEDRLKISEILYGQELKTPDKRISGILKGIDIGVKEYAQPENKIVDISIGNRKNGGFTEGTFHYKLYKSGTDQLIDDSVTTLEFIDFERLPKYFFNLTKLDNLEKIILPEGLKVIENDCFYNHRHSTYSSLDTVKHIEMPDSVEEIGNDAFNGCGSLESVRLSKNLKKIGFHSFDACTSLKHIEIPDSIEEIEDYAFLFCRSLESINLSANLKKIGAHCFELCGNLKYIDIPDSVEEIGDCAFENCKSLESVKLPANLREIGWRCFESCTNLKNIVIPDFVEEIGNGAFGSCSSLEFVKLPQSLKEIGNEMFYYCFNLKHIEIPDSVEKIGDRVFVYCDIESIKLPVNLKIIGGYCFSGCKNLKHIEMPGSVEEIGKFAFGGTSITDQNLIDKIKSINEKAF